MLVLSTLAAFTAPVTARAESGADLFKQHCAACHQTAGTGVPGAFPPLAGNPALEDAAHVRSIIENGLSGPLQVEGKSFNGTMPTFGDQLTSSEIQALTDYVRNAWGNDFGTPGGAAVKTAAQAGGTAETQTGGTATAAAGGTPGARSGSAPSAPAPAPAATSGDAAVGKALFSGSRRFQNGAPPCSACHTVQGEDPLGGGTMGRDLTTAYDRLGRSAGLRGVLTNIGFPVMRQVFARRPLTQAEIDDLVAYLRQTSATAQAQGTVSRNPSRFGFNWLWFFGAAGAALLFGLLLFGWPRQSESVAEHLRRTGRLGRHRR